MGASCSMTLLSQVSTSYPRVPRDSFARTRAYFLTYCPDTDSLRCSLASLFSFFWKILPFPSQSLFSIKTVLFWSFILSTVSIILWIVPKNKCSFLFFICFFAIHFPPVEEGEFLLYIMLNPSLVLSLRKQADHNCADQPCKSYNSFHHCPWF